MLNHKNTQKSVQVLTWMTSQGQEKHKIHKKSH